MHAPFVDAAVRVTVIIIAPQLFRPPARPAAGRARTPCPCRLCGRVAEVPSGASRRSRGAWGGWGGRGGDGGLGGGFAAGKRHRSCRRAPASVPGAVDEGADASEEKKHEEEEEEQEDEEVDVVVSAARLEPDKPAPVLSRRAHDWNHVCCLF